MKNKIILLLVILTATLSLSLIGQDEAYSNETRDNIFDSGSAYYSIGYGTDFENRKRITAQIKGIMAKNEHVGLLGGYSKGSTFARGGIGIENVMAIYQYNIDNPFLRHNFTVGVKLDW